ncbi:MAG: helix-turn-helix domain-containing protein [Clostridiales bacterium]|nr:helix-turn-helix domain-containing protein [Clostridiales bacterium]
MFDEYPDVLTVEEACEALRVGYNALYALLGSGEIPAYRNGRCWRIPKISIDTISR